MGRPPPFLRILVVSVVCVYTALHFFETGVMVAYENYYGDFLANFPAPTVAGWTGQWSVYADSLAHKWHPPPRWGFGPVFHLVTLPLLLSSRLAISYRVWLFVNYCFLALALVILYREAIGPHVTIGRLAIVGGLTLNYYPLYEALIQRNIEIFELTLIAVAMACYAKRRDGWAGAVVGMAAMTKFLPGILVPYFLLKRRRRAFVSSVCVILSLGVGAQFAFGWQHNWVVQQLVQGSYLEMPLNQAVSGAVLRLAVRLGHPTLGIRVSQALIAILVAGLAWYLWRRRASDEWQIEWALLVVAAIMLPPHNQNYYLTLLLIPYLVLLGKLFAAPRLNRWRASLLGLSWFLTGWPLPLSVVERAVGTSFLAELLLAASVSLWGVILLVGLLVTETTARPLTATRCCHR